MLPFVMLPRPLQESNVVGKGGTAGFLDLGDDSLRRFFVDVGDDDVRTLAGEAHGARPAHP